MQQTQYYGFLKPEATDNVTPDPFNTNADAIDLAIHNLSENKQDALSTSQMNALNSGMTTAKRQKLDALPTASELNTSFNGKQDTLTTAQLDAVNSGINSAKVAKLDALPTSIQLDGSLSAKANKSDITNINVTGTTNNTGSTILAGTLFYLNGTLCKTLIDVADGATFTESTNYITWSLKDTQDKVTVELIPNVLFIDKVGKLCILHTRGALVIPTGSHQGYEAVIEVNIPTGFRPISVVKSFAVSKNKNAYALELLNSSNKLSIIVWSSNPITVGEYEDMQFSLPYFTND